MAVKHLLGIRGLLRDEIYRYVNAAQSFVEVNEREIKKVPTLRGRTILNLFYEPSTRTLTSFDIAGKRLSADTVNISVGNSSVKKGETLLDTARTLEAMNPDVLVVRHSESGVPHLLSKYLSRTAVINAGDGTHEHPTQALLDLLTLKQHFDLSKRELEGLKIAIVGDVLHSRVARSNIWAHTALGNEVRLVGPATLVPERVLGEAGFGKNVSVHHKLASGIEGADVVLCLRMQLERQGEKFVPSLDEYCADYCITERILSKHAPKAVVLHPGPMNRGIEISSEVADGPRSLVARQVANGVATRMAVLFECATSIKYQEEQADE